MKIKQAFFFGLATFCLPVAAMAEQAAAAVATEGTTLNIGKFQMMRYVLAGFALLFFLILAVLAKVVKNAVKVYAEREQKKKSDSKIKNILPLLILFLSLSLGARAEETAAAATAPVENPLGMPMDIYLLMAVVAVEFAAIMVLSFIVLKFLKTSEPKPVKAITFKNFFQKVNQTVPVEDEASLDLQHDYDGIRELDNKIPKWWLYAFYATMVFGVIYIYRMFVAETLPNQFEELRVQNEIAAVQKEEYLKHSANNVDENNVKMLDAAGIAAGAVTFAKNCMACHGDKGQGGVGPNLTDDYWLHKGGIKDVFHSVKYGWPEKGMKSWKDDLSPGQIAEVSSYIKSLRGTNPPGAKEAQGELDAEGAAGSTAGAAADSTKAK